MTRHLKSALHGSAAAAVLASGLGACSDAEPVGPHGMSAHLAVASARVISVDCDVEADHTLAVQSAIDSAESGDVVEVVGRCFLDGGLYNEARLGKSLGASLYIDRSGVTLRGVTRDGHAAALIGVTLPSGAPATDCDHPAAECAVGQPPPRLSFNRGIRFGNVQDVKIERFEITGHHRAIIASGGSEPTSGWCEDFFAGAPFENKGLRIEGNHFPWNNQHVSVFGSAERITVEHNLFGEASLGVSFLGGEDGLTCYDPVLNAFVRQSLPSPEKPTVNDNVFVGAGGTASIVFDRSNKGEARRNVIDATRTFGIVLRGDPHVTASDNWVRGNPAGIFASLSGGKITHNTLVENQRGIVVHALRPGDFASGYRMSQNTFEGSGIVDIWLGSSSHDNTVLVESGTTVLDQGSNNTIRILP
jgi:hypothetical protein